jgi:hydrogenase expression/formation protein HypE
MHRLLEEVFLEAFHNDILDQCHDAAVIPVPARRLAFTTDSYVIQPLIFPGGDIGSLAVHGTVNDLAMGGARPMYLSAGFILEEGLEVALLRQIVRSMRAAADEAGVTIVTGDTKVVEQGKGDGIFINTAGIGIVEHNLPIGPASVCEGDAILLSGDVGRHGIAIMASREGLEFETSLESDSASVVPAVLALLDAGIEVHCLRDLTRGGLASAVNEIGQTSRHNIELVETHIPVRTDVQGACEMLGFDPLYVANEGRFIAIVPPSASKDALAIMDKCAGDTHAAFIGRVGESGTGRVTLQSSIGADRLLDMLSGEQLPRIC